MTDFPEVTHVMLGHLSGILAKLYDSLQSCNVRHNGVLLHMRDIPDINVNHIHFVIKHVVKFRYRITEEKHTNTTVKSSHNGKIEGIEY